MNLSINPCITQNYKQRSQPMQNIAFGTKFDIAPEVNTKLTSCLKNLKDALIIQDSFEKAPNGRHKHLLFNEMRSVIDNFTRKLYEDTILHNNNQSNHLIKNGSETMHKIDIYSSPKFRDDGGNGTYAITPENIVQKACEGVEELVFHVNGPSGGLNGASVHYKFNELEPACGSRKFSAPALKDRNNHKLSSENLMTSLQETLPEPPLEELFKKISSK